MSVRAYPCQWPKNWPKTPFLKRESATRFKNVTVAGALSGLREEVRRLGGRNLVLSSNYTLGNTTPNECGVVAYFEYEERMVAIPCDRWNKIEGNVRAIALTIEAMRGMERWGAKSMIAAMFTGFTALNQKTEESCWEVLAINEDSTEKQILDAYRTKVKTSHPDVEGGSAEAFDRVVRAKDMALQLINK